jgi:predicted double-glycine peptidase
MSIRAAGLLAVAATLASGCAMRTGGDPQFATSSLGTGEYRVPVASLLARKYANVVRQQYDFSCGSAALATLLHYHYQLPRNEADVFMGMWRDGDQAKIRQVGFSLLDMKRYLSGFGYSADGYRVSLDAISKRGLPGIALITNRGYRHFVVVKGIVGNEVLIGDPSLGLQVMSRDEFQKLWNGIYFVLNSRQEVGQANFNGARQWRAYARSPIGSPFVEPLSQQALALTAPFYRDF